MLSNTHIWNCIFNVSNQNFTYNRPVDETDIVFTLDWAVKSQDVVNGTSTIDWSMKVKLNGFEHSKTQLTSSAAEQWAKDATGIVVGNTGYPDSSFVDFSLVSYVQDDSYTGSHKVGIASNDKLFLEVLIGETKTIGSGTCVIPHNPDGTLTLDFRTSLHVDRTFLPNTTPTPSSSARSGYRGSFSTNYMTIDPISKHAIITSASDFTDEDSPAVGYAVPSGTSGYLYLSLSGNASDEDIVAGTFTGAGNHVFNFTAAEQKKLWKIQDQGLLTKRVRFFIKSVSTDDGLTYREPSDYVNLSIINYMPTLDTDVYDTDTETINYLTGNNRTLVRYVSKPYFKTGGQPHKGATIETQYCTHGGVNKFGATGDFTTVSGDDTKAHFDFAITDNYGRTHQETMEFSTNVGNYVPYVKLTSSATATPMTGDGDVTVTITGKFFSGDFGLKENKMRISFDIAENNGEWNHYDVGYATSASYYGNSFYINGTDYTYTLHLNAEDHGLQYLNVYDLRIMVSDEVVHEPVTVETILAAVPIFDWSRTDFAFYVPVTINEAAVPSIVEQVLNDNGWSYRKWSDGTAECWRTLSVTTAVSTSTNASWYSSGELSSTNLSFPFTFKARPSVTVQTMPTGSSWCIVFPSNTTGSTTKTGSYQLNSMSSTSSRAHLLSYDVKGRWK